MSMWNHCRTGPDARFARWARRGLERRGRRARRRSRVSDLQRIHILSWRDLDHPEAGGSELHINKLAERWAAAGLEVTLRTGDVPGLPADVNRNGYRVVRRGGRFTGFVRSPLSEAFGRQGPRDALVEVLLGLSAASVARPDIVSVDVNPLLIVDGKPVAVDALVEVAS